MFERILFLVLFLFDIYFTILGLLHLKNVGEAVNGFLFLTFVWYAIWSIHKIKTYSL